MSHLKIYFTSDLHGHFFPETDYKTKRVCQGVFQCASQFEKDEQTLVIDGGDMLQGSAFAWYCRSVEHSAQAMAERMNACGYDYYTLGNHDFNYGQEYLSTYRNAHHGVCLCQNVTDEEGNVLYPYVIRTMPDGLRVALIGIVTNLVNDAEKKENLEGIRVTDAFEAAKQALEEVKGLADLTICICHSGFECNLDTGKAWITTDEHIAYRICRELSFDILLSGHQHTSIAGQDIFGTYAVQPAEGGNEFHCLDVTVTDGKVTIMSQLCPAVYSAGKELCEMYQEQEKTAQSWMNQPIGHLSQPLLPGGRVSMALYGSPIADFINRVQRYHSGAEISVACLPNYIIGLPKDVSANDIIKAYPFADKLVVCEVNGRQLRAAMERSAEYFHCRKDGSVEISKEFLEPKVQHYNYDYYDGVEYRIDPKKPVGSRIVMLKRNGRDIRDEDVFTVCLNNYRVSGAGGYPMYRECPIVKKIDTVLAELMIEYLKSGQ